MDTIDDELIMGDASAYLHPCFMQLAFWVKQNVLGLPEVHHAAF